MKNEKAIRALGILTVVAVLCSIFTGCGVMTPSENTEAEQQTHTEASALSYVSLRINPEIEFVVDEDGEVVSANAVNEDGEVVLSDTEFVGMDVADAAETFTDQALELGYIDVEATDTTVYADVVGDDDEVSAEISKKLEKQINSYFENNGIFGRVSAETLEEYAEQAKEWGISKGHAKMVIRLLDLYPEMTAEEALALKPGERMKLIKAATKGEDRISVNQKKEMKTAVEALKEEYAHVFALREEIAAIEEQLKNKELGDEERAVLEATLSEKQEAYEAGYAEYKEKLRALKDECKEQSKREKSEMKERADKKRSENKERLEKHKKSFCENKESKKQEIIDWREEKRSQKEQEKDNQQNQNDKPGKNNKTEAK